MPRKAKPSDEKYILQELENLMKLIASTYEYCKTTAAYAAEADRKREVIFDVVMNMQSQLVQMRKLMDWIVADKLK